jgi:NAD(P)-dependent dehydrogenase (short-subunit alcohol dehydrogenase family)
MDTSRLFSLEGPTALITGGSRGIWRMIAEGYPKAPGSTSPLARGRHATPPPQSSPRPVTACPCPAIATPEGLADVVRLRGHEPALDILVDNAGAAWGAPFDEFPESGWDKCGAA